MSTNPFIVCKASAGSGKTFTLVKEYLRMALAGGESQAASRFRSVLAITFTNKAAAEMKNRIMHELSVMALAPVDPESHTMGAALLREWPEQGGLPKPSPEELQRMAAKLHSAILHRYTDFSVSTIDSFMHRIVRTFAHDLGQPMNFDVMIDQQELVDQAVAQLMSLAGTDGQQELTDVLQAFADSQMEEDRGYNVERLIADLASQLFKEDIETHLAKLSQLSLTDYQDLQRQYTGEVRRFEAALAKAGADMVARLDAVGLNADTAPYGASGYYGYFCRLAAGEVVQPTARTVSAFEGGKLTAAKAAPALKAAADAALPSLRQAYADLQQLLDRGLPRYNSLRAMLRNLYSTALLGELDRQMRLYAHDNEVVHLSDFNRLINSVVQDEDNPAPFIYERLGNRYRHFLIDEFQDTSIMQWHNLVPLLENGVSQRFASLVVGDGKQAIYRFRQGDVRQFARLPRVEGMVHHGAVLSMEGNYTMQDLDTNYRTASAIVEFNNRLFPWLAQTFYADNQLVQQLYAGAEQRVSKPMRGYVGLEFVSKTEADGDVKEAIYERILHTVTMLVGERGYRYSDIIILARGNAELAAIGSYLAQHSDVPQTSTESFYLRESHAVMAIVAVLRLLHDGADRVARADLEFRCQALGIAMPADLGLDYLATMPLYDCCEEVVRRLHLDGLDTAYVASLLGRVASFSARHRQDVGEFLEWFDGQERLSAAASDQLDAVRLLTIHKAKGLEAPVVICPLFYSKEYPVQMWVDIDEGPLPTAFVSLKADDVTTFEPQRLEEQCLSEVDDLNVLYVALTRPREQLYVFCPDPHDIKSRRERDLRYPSLLRAFVDAVEYDVGDPECRALPLSESELGKTEVAVGRLSFDDWTSRVHIASPSEKAITRLQEDKIRFGSLAHDLLAGVLHAEDVDDAVARFRMENNVDDELMGRLADLARAVVASAETSRFFDSSLVVKNECELVCDGKRLRPDRVVFAHDEAWVIDFKTGTPLDEHKGQVLSYCKALKSMGLTSVKGYLLYLLPEIRVVGV